MSDGRLLEGTGVLKLESGAYRQLESFVPVTTTRPSIAGSTFGTGPNADGTGSAITLATPAGTAIGDTLIAVLTSQTQVATDFGMPDGTWTRIGLATVNDATVRVLGFFVKKLTGTPAATYAFTTPGSGSRLAGGLLRVPNAHSTQPVAAAGAYGTRSGTTVTTPAFNSPEVNGLYLLAGNCNIANPNDTTISASPSGTTLIGSALSGLAGGSRTSLHIWQQNVDAVTPVAAKTHTHVGPTLAQAASNALILKPA